MTCIMCPVLLRLAVGVLGQEIAAASPLLVLQMLQMSWSLMLVLELLSMPLQLVLVSSGTH